jgi:hypothetical protein
MNMNTNATHAVRTLCIFEPVYAQSSVFVLLFRTVAVQQDSIVMINAYWIKRRRWKPERNTCIFTSMLQPPL